MAPTLKFRSFNGRGSIPDWWGDCHQRVAFPLGLRWQLLFPPLHVYPHSNSGTSKDVLLPLKTQTCRHDFHLHLISLNLVTTYIQEAERISLDRTPMVFPRRQLSKARATTSTTTTTEGYCRSELFGVLCRDLTLPVSTAHCFCHVHMCLQVRVMEGPAPFLHCHRQCSLCQCASHWQENVKDRGVCFLGLLSSEVSVHGSAQGRESREEQRWSPRSDQEAAWGMRRRLITEGHDPLTYFLLL